MSMLEDAVVDGVVAHRDRLGELPRERALHRCLPRLADEVEWMPLADGLPTRVDERCVDGERLWVKRDDLTSSLYGGNKARKVEYLFGGMRPNRDALLTAGAMATHHGLSCVLHGAVVGVDVALVLCPQADAPGIETNRRIFDRLDIARFETQGNAGIPAAFLRGRYALKRRGLDPKLVLFGGSNASGTLGYVDAACEIADAVAAGECPMPDVVFTAHGTGGTAVGLSIGFELAGLPTRVRAVRVADAFVNNSVLLSPVAFGVRRVLRRAGAQVARVGFGRYELETGYYGAGYGHATSAGADAMATGESAGLVVDQVYTAKALAATLDYARTHPREHVMFVSTLSSRHPGSG